MTGETVEDTGYAIDIILKQLKPEFAKMAIRAELKEVEGKIKVMKEEGIISFTNGIEKDHDKCMEAENLICVRNRLLHFLYHN